MPISFRYKLSFWSLRKYLFLDISLFKYPDIFVLFVAIIFKTETDFTSRVL